MLKTSTSGNLIESKSQYLQQNLVKMVKFQFVVKYQRHSFVEEPELAIQLTTEF